MILRPASARGVSRSEMLPRKRDRQSERVFSRVAFDDFDQLRQRTGRKIRPRTPRCHRLRRQPGDRRASFRGSKRNVL